MCGCNRPKVSSTPAVTNTEKSVENSLANHINLEHDQTSESSANWNTGTIVAIVLIVLAVIILIIIVWYNYAKHRRIDPKKHKFT
jgi:ABC-type spermidine/putrescine transport system permease subunit I